MVVNRWLFRGTTVGWEGNPALKEFEWTPTTVDPVIATLFAIECSRHGKAVVYAVKLADVAEMIVPSNVLSELEAEIVVNVSPGRFVRNFPLRMSTVENARSSLVQLEYVLPHLVSSRFQLQKAIEEYRTERPRIPVSAIDRFVQSMEGVK